MLTRLILGLSVLLAASNAHALIGVAPVGIANFDSSTSSVSGVGVTLDGKVGLGLGGLVTVPFGPLLSLETGLLLFSRKHTSAFTTSSHGRLQIPAMLKITSLPIVSFGAGPYLEMAIGDVGLKNEITGLESTVTYEALNRDSTDYGIAAAISADVALAPLIALLFDVRYQIGLKNLSRTASTEFKFRGFQVLAGVKFSL